MVFCVYIAFTLYVDDLYKLSIYIDIGMKKYVFFFKQKTAYEMRISDWSSDVCSSDLGIQILDYFVNPELSGIYATSFPRGHHDHLVPAQYRPHPCRPPKGRTCAADRATNKFFRACQLQRSEEHTSELQSLMRISYAVFCLKKKQTQKTHYNHVDLKS